MISGVGRPRMAVGALLLAGTVALTTGCGSSAASPTGAGGAAGELGAAGGVGTGGAVGSGGVGAGDAATVDAPSPFILLYDFSTGAQASAAGVANTADTNQGDLGVFLSSPDGGTRASTSWDQTVGSPDPGSLAIQIPCDAYGQFVDYQFVLPVITDMGKKTLSMMLRLDSGFSPDVEAEGYVLLYAKSGDNWDWGQTATVHLAPTSVGQWIKYTFPMNALAAGSSSSFDPGYVKSVGIQINTGAGSGATDPPTPARFHIDSIGYQ